MPESIRHAYVDTARGQLHYRTQGQGRPVVLLQILPFSTVLLDGLIEALTARGWASYAFDLMGYGQSAPRPGVWEVKDHAATLAEALTHLGLEHAPIISGHFSCMVAAELSLQHSRGPSRLVMDGVPLIAREVAAERLAAPDAADLLLDDGVAVGRSWAAVIALLRRFDPSFTVGADNQAAVFAAFAHFMHSKLGPDATAPLLRYDMESALARLTCPVLVIGSTTDSLRAYHDKAVSLAPGARSYLFEPVHPLYPLGAGVDAGERYLEVVGPFLEASPS